MVRPFDLNVILDHLAKKKKKRMLFSTKFQFYYDWAWGAGGSWAWPRPHYEIYYPNRTTKSKLVN